MKITLGTPSQNKTVRLVHAFNMIRQLLKNEDLDLVESYYEAVSPVTTDAIYKLGELDETTCKELTTLFEKEGDIKCSTYPVTGGLSQFLRDVSLFENIHGVLISAKNWDKAVGFIGHEFASPPAFLLFDSQTSQITVLDTLEVGVRRLLQSIFDRGEPLVFCSITLPPPPSSSSLPSLPSSSTSTPLSKVKQEKPTSPLPVCTPPPATPATKIRHYKLEKPTTPNPPAPPTKRTRILKKQKTKQAEKEEKKDKEDGKKD